MEALAAMVDQGAIVQGAIDLILAP